MNWFQRIFQRIKSQGGLTDQGYDIDNAEKCRDKDPRSFSIPREEQRRALKVGDSAKIILQARNGAGFISGERTWVKVEEVGDGYYKVRVDNFLVLFPSLNEAMLTIRPENIVSVVLPDEYVLPFGKTCLVSAAVLQDTAWPARLVRVIQAEEGDSGWRIFSKGESLTDALQKTACAELMAQYQVLDSVMDEPGLSSWVWDEHSNEFARDKREITSGESEPSPQ